MVSFKKNGIDYKVDTFDEFLEIIGKKVEPGKESKYAKHVGKLKWNIDAVEYQRKIRDECQKFQSATSNFR